MPDQHILKADGMGLRQTVHPVQYHQAVAVSEDLQPVTPTLSAGCP